MVGDATGRVPLRGGRATALGLYASSPLCHGPTWWSTAAMLFKVDAVSLSAASPRLRRILSALMKKARLWSYLARSLCTTPKWCKAVAQPEDAVDAPEGPASATSFSLILKT